MAPAFCRWQPLPERLKSARLEAQTPKSPRTLSFWRTCEDGEKVHAAQPTIRGFWMRFQGSATPWRLPASSGNAFIWSECEGRVFKLFEPIPCRCVCRPDRLSRSASPEIQSCFLALGWSQIGEAKIQQRFGTAVRAEDLFPAGQRDRSPASIRKSETNHHPAS